MQIQSIFKAGNSHVVAIPANLMKEMGFKVGEKIVVEKNPADEEIIIKKPKQVNSKKSTAVSTEFKKWWDQFLDENKEILDELAVR